MKRPFLPYLIVLIAVISVYSQSLFFGLSYLDDNTLIKENIGFLKNPTNIARAFMTDVFFTSPQSYYRPVMTLLFMAESQIGGADPFIYHLTNLVLHAAVCLLLLRFLIFSGLGKRAALALALVFAVHPVLTQATTWIPGRNDSLMALFMMALLMLYDKYLDRHSPAYLAAFCGVGLVALFTKETAIAALPILLLYTYLFKREALFSKGTLTVSVLYILMTALWFMARTMAFNDPIYFTVWHAFPLFVQTFPAAFLYMGKVFFPFNQCVLPIMADNTVLFGIVSVMLFTVAAYFVRPFTRLFWFGLAWTFLFLFPSFIQPNPPWVPPNFSEHRLYLPMIGLLLSLYELAAPLRKYLTAGKKWALLALLLAAMVPVNAAYSRNFRDGKAFWLNAATYSPNFFTARVSLGYMYFLEGDDASAEREYRQALLLNPRDVLSRVNLANLYTRQGRYDLVEKEYREVLTLDPREKKALLNMGSNLVFRALSEKEPLPPAALAYWLKALEIDPGFLEACGNIIFFYVNTGRPDLAAPYAAALIQKGGTVQPQLLDPIRRYMEAK